MQQIAYFIILSFPLWKDRIPLSKTVSGDRRPFMAWLEVILKVSSSGPETIS